MARKLRAIIHVGLHKTGTSALQTSLATNAASLARQGFLYPLSAGERDHSYLATLFLKSDHQAARALVDQTYADARKTGAHTVIFSSEMFSEHPVDMGYFGAIFSSFDVEIIAYVRRPDEIVISAYNELVRDDSSRWITRLPERLPYDPTFHGVIGKWLGDADWKFVIAPYDKPQWHGGSLLSDFLSMIGVDVRNIDMQPIEKVVNESLPPRLLEIVRVANTLELPKNERSEFIKMLYRIADAQDYDEKFLGQYDEPFRRQYCEQLVPYLWAYRRHFREGFDEGFLLPEAVGRKKR